MDFTILITYFGFQSEDRVNISWSDNTISNDQNSAVINSNNPSRVVEIEPYYGSSIGRKGKIKNNKQYG